MSVTMIDFLGVAVPMNRFSITVGSGSLDRYWLLADSAQQRWRIGGPVCGLVVGRLHEEMPHFFRCLTIFSISENYDENEWVGRHNVPNCRLGLKRQITPMPVDRAAEPSSLQKSAYHKRCLFPCG